MTALLSGAGPDIIYESVGGAITMASLGVLAPLGQIVIYGALNIQQFELGVPDLLGLIFKNQSLTGFAVAPLLTPASLKAELGALIDLAARGDLTVTIGGTYPLAAASDAHRALEAGYDREAYSGALSALAEALSDFRCSGQGAGANRVTISPPWRPICARDNGPPCRDFRKETSCTSVDGCSFRYRKIA